jgi:hypothetical protein
LSRYTGWISVGNKAAFAVNALRRWWQEVGRVRYPEAEYLTIAADGGCSNGSRVKRWKRALQALANELGIEIAMHHQPPETSKWNKIEHRPFSYTGKNWQASPSVGYRVIVDLIGVTTTKTGLTVRCELDPAVYPKGIVVSDPEMAAIDIVHNEFHGEWNDTIGPRNHTVRAIDFEGTVECIRPMVSHAIRHRRWRTG